MPRVHSPTKQVHSLSNSFSQSASRHSIPVMYFHNPPTHHKKTKTPFRGFRLHYAMLLACVRSTQFSCLVSRRHSFSQSASRFTFWSTNLPDAVHVGPASSGRVKPKHIGGKNGRAAG